MDKLGIDPKLLLAQIVNFSIIAFVMSKFLYKPILEMLEKRKAEIQKGLDLTKKMEEEELKFEQKKAKMLEMTRKEAQSILEQARKQGKEEEKEIIAQAHVEAEHLAEKAKKDIEEMRAEMEKDIQSSAVDLAAVMAERLIQSALTKQDAHALVAKQIKTLSSMKVK